MVFGAKIQLQRSCPRDFSLKLYTPVVNKFTVIFSTKKRKLFFFFKAYHKADIMSNKSAKTCVAELTE